MNTSQVNADSGVKLLLHERVQKGQLSEKEAIDIFKVDQKETLDTLSSMEWNLHSDLDVQIFQMTLFEQAGQPLVDFVRSARDTGVNNDDWVGQKASWEEGMAPAKRIQARQEIMSACVQRMVTPEFVKDVKDRWEKAEFSSVTKDFIVIGDVYVRRQEQVLPLKDEIDVYSGSSELGRLNVTYSIWKEKDLAQNITAVRPKINGERFTRVVQGGQVILRGFKDLMVGRDFVPDLVEYYGGDYYVLSPQMKGDYIATVSDRGHSVSLVFRPHPFLTPQEFFKRRREFCGHEYDGIMLWDGEQEYRAKFEPTVEIDVAGTTWEVQLTSTLIPLRPRPGKIAVTPTSAVARIRTCFRAQFILPFLGQICQEELPTEILHAQVIQEERSQASSSAKIFFVTPTRKLLGIRLPGKKFDFIGGEIMSGETPLQAVIREYREETGFDLDTVVLAYLGKTKETTDDGFWTSHLFIAVASPELEEHRFVETFAFTKLEEFRKSNAARPRAMWMSGYLTYLQDFFWTWEDVWSLAVYLWGVEKDVLGKPPKIRVMTPSLEKQRLHPLIFIKEWMQNSNQKDGDPMIGFNKYLSCRGMPRPQNEIVEAFASVEDISLAKAPLAVKAMQKIAPLPVKSPLQDIPPDLVKKVQDWGRGTTQHQLMSSSESSTSSTTSASPYVPAFKGGGADRVFPTTREASFNLLLLIFGCDRRLTAQDFYLRLKQQGWTGKRKTAISWVDHCMTLGAITAMPATTGKGRVFQLMWN